MDTQARITENRCIARMVFEMHLQAEGLGKAAPGQFAEIEVPGFFLRRPISIAYAENDEMVLVYKAVGKGTKTLSEMKEGQLLRVLSPLGTGFPVENRDVLLLAGGVGLPPMYFSACAFRKLGRNVTVVLGCASAADVFWKEKFEAIGCTTYIATMDGSLGTKGTVLDAVREHAIDEKSVLACGPMPMLKAVSAQYKEGYVSLESRMACGIGMCMGCVVKDQEGNSLRVCKDGPVFPIGKVVL